MESERVALVAGVTGIVGVSLAELLPKEEAAGGRKWRVYGIARRPRPQWFADYKVDYIQCDLLDREQTFSKLSTLTDVTHVFFVTWASRDTEEENIQDNGSMLRNTLDALLTNGKGLQHVCLQTGTKHYLGSHYSWSGFDDQINMRVFHEDEPRLGETNFYYAQEDILQEVATSRAITWSVHRAAIIFGVSPNATVNGLLALASYACICKQDGSPFIFPGSLRSWESHVEVSDSDLVAEQEIWAATHDAGKNEALNIANGDTVAWKTLWPAIARSFDLEVVPYTGESGSLVEIMQNKAHVWEGIVSKYGLHPTRWEDLVRTWWMLDLVCHKLPPYRMSMAKSTKLGFLGSRDTNVSLLATFENMKKMGLIPG